MPTDKTDDSQATVVRFSKKEADLLKQMQADMGARSKAEVVRKSIAQTSTLRKLADDQDFLNVLDDDGNVVRIPINW